MTPSLKVFVSVLIVLALVGMATASERSWGYYILGSLIVAAATSLVFAGLRRLTGRGERTSSGSA